MHSHNSSPVEQGHLPLTRQAAKTHLPVALVVKQKTLLGAVNLCIAESGLEDKEIYLALEIDAGHFSNLRKGVGHFPTNKLNDLCDLCGNEAPLQWWANHRGDGLVVLKSEAERQRDEEKARADKAEQENALLRNLLIGKSA